MKKTTLSEPNSVVSGLFPSLQAGRRWLSTLAGATMLVLSAATTPAATIVQEFFLPMPESQLYQALSTIQTTGVGTTQNSIYSIVVTGNGTVIYYDHWEDPGGYEVSLGNPTQPSTLVWGDGNNANGITPGFVNDPVGIPAGTVITLTNNVPLPRNPSNLLYDGRDRIGATKALVVVHAGWPVTPGPVFAGAASVLSTIDYGTNYISPVGQNLTNAIFGYVGMFVMAAQDNTFVTIDPDGPGTNAPISFTLNRGESYLYNGGIRVGGRATASKPIQANLLIGKINGNYAADWFTLYPVEDWDNTYYTPVGTPANGNTSFVYLYNPNTNALTINYTTRVGSGSIVVPATNGVTQFAMPVTSGAKFASATGQPFNVLETVAARPGADTAYNWGFTPVPQAALTTEAVVGWGPGSADGTVNGNPAWVTPLAPTTIYVDYKGDRAGPLTDPNGNKYDTNYVVTTYQSRTIFDPSRDQSGMRIYTVDGTLLSAAWGQDPDTAAPGNPYIDAGSTVLPFPVPTLAKTATNFVDNFPSGLSTNDIIKYTVTIDNKGLLPLGNTVVIDTPSGNLAYVTNTTTLDGQPLPDSVSGTPFPLDSPGYVIPIILRAGTSTFSYQARVTAPGVVSNSVNISGTTLTSQTIITPSSGAADQCVLNFTDAGGIGQASYLAGANVFVTMSDTNYNTSSNTLQSLSVIVRNPARGDLEPITLTETGTNTGVFRNLTGLPTSLGSGFAQQDGVLNVVAGDLLTVTNVDAAFGDTCSAAAVIQVPASGKVLYLSDPSQALDRVDPVATGDGTTASSIDIGSGGGGSGVVSIISTNVVGVVGPTSLVTLTNVNGGSGTNRMLLVSLSLNPNGSSGASSITFGSQNFTLVSSIQNAGNQVRAEIWRLLSPNSVTTNVVVNFGSAQDAVTVAATLFTNVNLTTPFSLTNAVTGSALPFTNNYASAVNESVFNVVSIRSSTSVSALSPGQTRLWAVTNLAVASGGSLTPGAASVANAWNGTGGSPQWAAIGVSIRPAAGGGSGGPATNVTSFTQTPTFASNFIISSNNTIAITNFITLTNGTLSGTPAVTATLRYGSTNIITLSNPTYTAASNRLVWQGTLATNVTIPTGAAITLDISNGVPNTAFRVNYDSTTAPSKIILPTSTIIDLATIDVYDAPYPGGSIVSSPTAGQTLYVRAFVTDPFGNYDITSLGLTIDGPGASGDIAVTLTNSSVVATTAGSKTYEYVWTTISNPGGYNLSAIANEGTEGITDTLGTSVTLSVLDLGTPSSATFTSGNDGVSTNAYPLNNGSACVRVTDLDQNLTNTVAENLLVTITSSAGDSQTLLLTETTTNSGIFTSCLTTSTNVAAIAATNQLYAPAGSILTISYTDPNDPSDTSSANATILTAAGVPAISMSKTLLSPTDGQAGVGETVTFNLQVVNTGSTTLTNVTVRDNYPSNSLSYVSASLAPTTATLGVLTWSGFGNFAPGQTTNFTVTFTATNVNASAVNFATGSSTTATNITSASVIITRSAVTVVKSLLNPTSGPVNIGSNVVFRITVTNTGSTTLTTLPLQDTFSSATYTNISATIPPDGRGPGSLLWNNLGPLNSGSGLVIDVTMRVVGASSNANNTATADFVVDNFGNPVPSSTSITGLVTVAASITGSVINDTNQSGGFNLGEPGLPGVTLSLYTDPNGDGDPADGALVQEVTTDANGNYELLNLPTNRYVIVETDLPGYASTFPLNNRLALNVTNFVASTNNNFFDYQPSAAIYATFTGTVWDDANSNATNDLAEVGLGGVTVDLIQDVNTNGLADLGEPVVSSTTTATNGQFSFFGVIPGSYVLRQVDLFGYYSTGDSAGANDNFIGRTVGAAAASTNNSFFDHFNLPPVANNDTTNTPANVPVVISPLGNDTDPDGNPLVITLLNPTNGTISSVTSSNFVFTPSANFTGTATIGYSISDGFGGTATALITVTVTASADVSVTKSAASSVTAGQNLTYTITVTNAGPSVATNVIASDTLPAGVTVFNLGGGSSNNGVVTWPAIATLASGASSSYTLVITAPANSTTLTNFAAVTNSTPEPTLTNNITPPVITTVTASADVSVSKTAAGSVTAGQSLTYTITVTNAGPSVATNVIASDTLPAGVTVFNLGGGSSNNGVVTWPSIPTLASGASSSYTLIVTVPSSGILTNFANVTNSTPEPTLTNNITPPVITTIGESADVSIAKSAATNVLAGANLTYTITVTNAGPSSATNVVVTDPLPNGAVFVSASNSGTTNGSNVVTWPAITTLASGAASTYTFTVTAPANGILGLTNIASFTTPTPDPTPTNNTTPPVITTVTPSADVRVGKAGPAGVSNRVSFSYSITVTNFGPSTATSLSVTDALPAGLVFVSAVPAATTNGSQVVWTNLGNLTLNATTNLTLTVVSTGTGSVTNFATGGSPTSDPNPTNNVGGPVITAITNLPPVAVNDSASTPEDTAVTIGVLSNDFDVNGDVITLTNVLGVTNGTVNIVGTNVVYTPATNFFGTNVFNYVITDGFLFATGTVTVVVSPVNDAPVAVPLIVVTPEDTSTNLVVFGTDVDSTNLTYSILVGPTNGGLSGFNPTTGAVTYLPSTNYNGPDAFTFTVCDGGGLCSTGLVSITVTPVNDAPVAVPLIVVTPEDTSTNLVVFGTDVDSTNLTYTILAGPTNGSLSGFNPTTGAVTYLPSTNYNGPDAFTFTVCDGSLCATGLVSITVTPVNDAPVAVNDNATTPQGTPVTINVLTNDFDVDLDALTLTNVISVTNGTVNIVGTNVFYTPATNFYGTNVFRYVITDGSLFATGTVTVVVGPLATTATPLSSLVVCPGSPATFSTVASGSAPFSYVWRKNGIAQGSTSNSLNIASATAADAGTYSVEVTGFLGSATNSATLTVNTNVAITSAPVDQTNLCLGGTANFSVGAVGTGVTYQWYFGTNLLAGATNSALAITNVGALTAGNYSVVVSGTCNSVTNSAVLALDSQAPAIVCPGDITVNAAAGQCGSNVVYTIGASDNCGVVATNRLAGLASGSLFPVGVTTNTYSVVDALGNSNMCSFTVTVVDTQPPVINTPANITVNAAPGVCGSNVTFTVTATDNCGTNSVNSVPASGSLFAVGTTTVTNTVTDIHGNTNTSTFTVTVVDTQLPQFTCPATIVRTNDAGQCGATFSLAALVATDNCGSVTVSSNAPATFPVGTNSVTWTVVDSNGNTNTCVQTVIIRDVELPVINTPSNITVNAAPGVCGSNVTFTVTATDNCGTNSVSSVPASGSLFPVGTTTVTNTVVDIHGNTNRSTFTVTVVDTQPPVINTPANITVNAAPGVCGSNVTFTVTATDNCGTNSVSSVPASGSLFQVGTTTVTNTVTDIHGNTNRSTFTVTVVDRDLPTISCPSNLVVIANSGFTATNVALGMPTFGDNCGTAGVTNNAPLVFSLGTNLVTWVVTDINGNTNFCTQQVVVLYSNRPPVAVNDTNATPRNVAITLDPRVNDSDLESNVLAIVSVSGTNGVAVINGGTNVTFTPALNFQGLATIGYTISDGDGGFSSAVIYISVTNRPPVANNDTATTPKNVSVVINPRVNDTDPDGDVLTITSVTPVNGSTTIIGGTNILFLPSTNFTGTAFVNYTISDGFGGTSAAQITITVTGPPTPMADVAILMTGTTNVAAGNAIIYNITVTNLGPLTATNVVASNALPAGFVFVSATGGGTYSNNVVRWPTVPTLPFGGFTNYTLTVYTTNIGTFTNIASAAATGPFDPNLTNNNGTLPASRVVTVVVQGQINYGPLVFSAGQPVFNPQTGFYQETVFVTNDLFGVTVTGFRLYVVGLRPGVILQNAFGTNNGQPYVQYNHPLQPGEVDRFQLEFLSLDRRTFSNTFRIELNLQAYNTNTVGTPIPLDPSRLFLNTSFSENPAVINSVFLDFTAIPGRTYTILYTDDFSEPWKAAISSVRATANVVQWIDAGPPKTDTRPGSKRFYRVILLP